MTPVLVATEQEGVARIYLRDASGGLTQTAQLLIGTVVPTELAAAAADMNDRFRWDRVVSQRKRDAAALPSASPVHAEATPERVKQTRVRQVHRTRAEIEAYRLRVHSLIEEHPGISTPALVIALHGERAKVNDNLVRQAVEVLINLGQVRKVTERNEPNRYYARAA